MLQIYKKMPPKPIKTTPQKHLTIFKVTSGRKMAASCISRQFPFAKQWKIT